MQYSIGIDLGGTKIEGCLMDSRGSIIFRCRQPTEPNKSKEKIIANIIKAINILIARIKPKSIAAIGIGHPGFSIGKKLTSIHNIKRLNGSDLCSIIQKKTGIKTFAENDANCFALAEHSFGAGKNCKNMIGLIIGTGIGAGIIINSQPYKGSHGGAGEIGYLPFSEKTFEQLCSGPNIVKRYAKAGGKIKNANPSGIFASKEAAAKKITAETIDGFAKGLAAMISCYDPDIIVIGGGVSNAFSLFMPKVRKLLPKYAPNKNTTLVKIVKNTLGDDAGVIGAGLLSSGFTK